MLPYDEAVEKIEEALKIVPHNAELWCSWGVALMELQRTDEAIEKFEKAAALDPELASAWYGWGIALMASGQKEAAAEKIKQALQLDPEGSRDPSESGLESG